MGLLFRPIRITAQITSHLIGNEAEVANQMERAERTEKEHASKHVDIESKRFFFDVKENHKGKYLRITELSGGRSCIVIPLGGISLFKERLGEIIEEAEKLVDAPASF